MTEPPDPHPGPVPGADRRHTGLRRRLPHVPAKVAVPVGLALALFLAGPRVVVDEAFDPVEVPEDVDEWLAASEADLVDLRPGEAHGIVWSDSTRTRTPVAVVYLHGFSADRHEIDPVPRRVAEELGANLYYARLSGHGRGSEAMAEASVRDWFQDAARAVAVGRRIGDRVVVMGTSTGATLAVWAAAHEVLGSEIAALALISPNFQPRDPNSRLLLLPWGAQIARVALGPERCFEPANEQQRLHWTTCYPTEALLPMMGLVERVRTLDLSQVRAPTVALYSPDDQVVDARATESFFPQIGAETKELVPFTESEAPAQHVLAGDIVAPASTERVVEEILAFLDPIVGAGGATGTGAQAGPDGSADSAAPRGAGADEDVGPSA